MRNGVIYVAMLCVVMVSCFSCGDICFDDPSQVKLRTTPATRFEDKVWQTGDEIGLYMVVSGAEDLSEPQMGVENLLYCATTVDLSYAIFTPYDKVAEYPLNGGKVDLYAYYPYSKVVNNAISVVPNVDYMHAVIKSQSSANEAVANLPLDHMMMKVNMAITTTDSDIDLSGMVVTYKGYVAEAVMDLYSGLMSNSVYKMADVTACTSASGQQSSVLLIPVQGLTAKGTSVEFLLSNGVCYTCDMSEHNLMAGCKYNCDVVIGSEQAHIKLFEIATWVQEDEGELVPTTQRKTFIDTADDPLVTSHFITSAKELHLLSDKIASGKSYNGMTFTLLNDIDMSSSEEAFSPIGSSNAKSFQGVFDGAGYAVRSLSVGQSGAVASFQALFGYVHGATIKNLVVEGAVTGAAYVGGVVGCASSSTILNCGSRVTVNGMEYVGGVVGYLLGGGVYNSYNTGAVKMIGSGSVGGLLGYIEMAAKVECCYNAGAVVGYSAAKSGGVVGYNSSSSINNCFWAYGVNGAANVTDSYKGNGTNNIYTYLFTQMQSVDFVSTLNSFSSLSDEWISWQADTAQVNGGYPIFSNIESDEK